MEKRDSSLLFLGIALALLFLALSTQPAQAKSQHYKRPKHYTFYLHNTLRNFSSDHFTAVVSAQPENLGPEFNQFGMLTTFEDRLTKTSSNTSELLGKGLGFYLYDVQKVHVMFFVFTAVIENDKYNGTIDIIGQNPTNIAGKRYLSVIGGTGDFFLARGLATLEFLGATRNLVDHQVTWVVSFHLDLYYQ